MQRLSSFAGAAVPARALRTAILTGVAAAAVALGSASPAGALTAELRVEAGGKPLSASSFATRDARIQFDQRSSCGGSGNVGRIEADTPLGLLANAGRVFRGLRPLSVSDRFGFGLFVCGIGTFVGDASSFWLYKVDHVSPEVGGDQFALEGGQRVLWYFSDTSRGVNTGDELELVAPPRVRSGQSFQVTVNAYDSAGRRTPAAGALVFGETVQRTRADGTARIFSERQGSLRLRAIRGSDIPSAPQRVCLNRVLSRCPAARGQRIHGTSGGDRLEGTAGRDVISARGGNDRIDVRGGGRDRVRCGRGFDRVVGDRSDRFSRDCERRSRRR